MILGLLEDVRVFYDGHPPRTSEQYWDPETPYMPEIGMGRPAPPLPPPPPPDASPHRVLERFGHLENGEAITMEDEFEDPEEEPSNGWGYHPKPAVDDDENEPADPTKTPPRPERPVRLGASIVAKSAEERAEAAVKAAAAEALSGWQEKLAEDMDRPGTGGLPPGWLTEADELRLGSCMLRQAIMIQLWLDVFSSCRGPFDSFFTAICLGLAIAVRVCC